MKFVAVSDTHSRHREISLPPADVIIHGGDVSKTGNIEEIHDFIQWFKDLNYTHKIFIAGNHDFYLESISKKNAEKELIPPGIIYLNDKGTKIENIKIWGSPVQPWFYDWAFNRKRGEEIKAHWDLIPTDTDLLITHGPPYGILDKNSQDENVGCMDLLNKVNKIHPQAHIFGHIHEGFGEEIKAGIHFINASVLDEYYRLVNRPITFEVYDKKRIKK